MANTVSTMYEEKQNRNKGQGHRPGKEGRNFPYAQRRQETRPPRTPLRPTKEDGSPMNDRELQAYTGFGSNGSFRLGFDHLPDYSELLKRGSPETDYLNRANARISATPERPQRYRVAHGESLAMIAAKFGVEEEELKRANQDSVQAYQGRRGTVWGFREGTEIIIPATTDSGGTVGPGTAAQQNGLLTEGHERIREEEEARPSLPSQKTYTVSAGENLARIAEKFGVDPEALKTANPTLLHYYGARRIAGFEAGEAIVIPEKEAIEALDPIETLTAPASLRATIGPEGSPEIAATVERELGESTHALSLLASLETGGAGAETSRQDSHGLTGVAASERMAKDDLERMMEQVPLFKKVGRKYDLPPALVAAIASRESRGGKALSATGYGSSDAKGFGLMQVDKDNHEIKGTARSEEHIDQAVGILAGQLKRIVRKHPTWSEAEQLRGAVAAYNFDARNVDTLEGMDRGTTGNDYSADIWARARYYESLTTFGGEGPRTTSGAAEVVSEVEAPRYAISASVGGSGGSNHTLDVRFVQNRLVELGLLSLTEAKKEWPLVHTSPLSRMSSSLAKMEDAKVPSEGPEDSTVGLPPIAEEKLPLTIAAIRTFQQKVLRSEERHIDGRVDPSPNGTLRQLIDTAPGEVALKLREYPRWLQEKQRRAEAKAAAEAQALAVAEAQKEAAAKEEKRKRDAARATQERIAAIRAMKADESTAKDLIVNSSDTLALAGTMNGIAPHHPDLVLAVFDALWHHERDNLAHAMAHGLTNAELARLSLPLRRRMVGELRSRLNSLFHNQKMAELADRIEVTMEVKQWTATKRGPFYSGQRRDVDRDIEHLRSTFKQGLMGSVGADPGSGVDNYKDDVKRASVQLKALDYSLSEAALVQGEADSTFIEAIKAFQKDRELMPNPDGNMSARGTTVKALFPESGGYNSGLPLLYPNRGTLNAILRKARFRSRLRGDVGADIGGKRPENYPEDVLSVARKLQDLGYTIPLKTLLMAKPTAGLITAIREYQCSEGLYEDGNIAQGGLTDQKLSGYRKKHIIGYVTRDKYDPSLYEGATDREAYYATLDKLQYLTGAEGQAPLNEVLSIARLAAQDEDYFNALTATVEAKVLIDDKDIEDQGTRLSLVLQGRMEKLHRFLVLVGLYKGDMQVRDAVRSRVRAHGFAVQYRIVTDRNKAEIKNNLIRMYNGDTDKIYLKGDYVEDEHGHQWAKKSHFTTDREGRATDLDYAAVQAYVATLSLGRSNIRKAASAGFKRGAKCLPLPEDLGVSRHTEGGAMDINYHNFVRPKEAMIDLIALNFGLVRAGGSGETWHFELSDLEASPSEKKTAIEKKR